MKARFQSDHVSEKQGAEAGSVVSERTSQRYVNPTSLDDGYDASERDFAVSLEKPANKIPQFVVETEPSGAINILNEIPVGGNRTPAGAVTSAGVSGVEPKSKQQAFVEFSGTQATSSDTGDTWRDEVSARLSKYQSRRRLREPRYPSLQLKFESQEAWRDPAAAGGLRPDFTQDTQEPVRVEVHSSSPDPARVIQFPRSSLALPQHQDELAEPVFDRPRILEAPDVAPPSPALGGIMIETVEAPTNERRPGFEMPLRSAPMASRLAATATDAFLVFVGVALFGYVSWRIVDLIPTIRSAGSILAVSLAIMWAAYQYLLIVHCGTTPGLKLAKLRLTNFDGSPVRRKMRRWRAFASMLSGLSLGLGYAWCFLDEDQLCWHDRITGTYIAPRG